MENKNEGNYGQQNRDLQNEKNQSNNKNEYPDKAKNPTFNDTDPNRYADEDANFKNSEFYSEPAKKRDGENEFDPDEESLEEEEINSHTEDDFLDLEDKESDLNEENDDDEEKDGRLKIDEDVEEPNDDDYDELDDDTDINKSHLF